MVCQAEAEEEQSKDKFGIDMINYLTDEDKNPIFIECDINLREVFESHRDNMIESYGDKIQENVLKKTYNVEYKNCLDDLVPIYEKALQKIFVTQGDDKLEMASWIYVQKPDKQYNKFHKHSHIMPSPKFCTVTYFDTPQHGGEFCFKYRDEEYIINVKEDLLYLFPNWLEHKPMPHQGEETRICLNVDFFTKNKFLFKEFDHYW